MNRGSWKKPVVLEIFGRPGTITVSDTLDAALMMLAAWPCKRTDAHLTAVRACRDALTGKASPSLARADFIGAALEAGFHVQPETFLYDNEEEEPEVIPYVPPRPSWLPPLSSPMIDQAIAPDPTMPAQELPDSISAYLPAPSADAAPATEKTPVTWTEHFVSQPAPTPAARADIPDMHVLLIRLAETLGMIMLVTLQNAAGLLNIDIRRRRPGRAAPQ
jgi:hypothetical protein